MSRRWNRVRGTMGNMREKRAEYFHVLGSKIGSTPNFMISFAIGFVFALLLFGAYKAFQTATDPLAGRAFEKAISTPPSDRTCVELGGRPCDDPLDCQGIIRTAFDEDSCCIGVCRSAPPSQVDINGDGGVSSHDLRTVMGDIGTGNLRSDVDGNGIVDTRDVTIVAKALRNP